MSSFADASDLEDALGRSLAGGDEISQALAVLDRVTSEMRAYMRQDITQASETITLDPVDSLTLVLPKWPVTAVSAVTVDGAALSLPGDIKWYSDGRLVRDNGTGWSSWGWKRQSVVVTYTHGFATVPQDLRDVCTARAMRLMENPTGLQQETIGSYSYVDATAGAGGGFLDTEKAIMDGYADMVTA